MSRYLVSDAWNLDGAVAQLGEHLLCKQGVAGSSPVSSTNKSELSAAEFGEYDGIASS